MINKFFIIFISLGGGFFIIWILYKRYRGFSKSIKSDLEKFNLKFISSFTPPLFSKSPFSNFELYDYHPDTSFLGISGEDVFRRIVLFEDEIGKQHKLWVEIQTRGFIVHKMKWEKDLIVYQRNG